MEYWSQMEKPKFIQNDLVLSEEEKIIHEPRPDRRMWLNCDHKTWPLAVKEGAICPTNIQIEEDLWHELSEIVQHLEYSLVHTVLNICFWPTCNATDRLKEKIQIFQEDIDKYIVLRNNPGDTVYPHKDPVRGTTLYLPLLPKGEDYMPLEIYYNNGEYGVPANDKPTVWMWNTKATHAVFVNNFYRYNIQASINLPYNEVFVKYKDVFDI